MDTQKKVNQFSNLTLPSSINVGLDIMKRLLISDDLIMIKNLTWQQPFKKIHFRKTHICKWPALHPRWQPQPRCCVVKPHVTTATDVIGWMALGDAWWEFFPMINRRSLIGCDMATWFTGFIYSDVIGERTRLRHVCNLHKLSSFILQYVKIHLISTMSWNSC